MLGTARWLKSNILVYWSHETGKGWTRYPAEERGAAPRAAFLFHCNHSQVNEAFHCEPLINWPIEKSVVLLNYISSSVTEKGTFLRTYAIDEQ